MREKREERTKEKDRETPGAQLGSCQTDKHAVEHMELNTKEPEAKSK